MKIRTSLAPVAAVLLLAACSAEPEPDPLPPVPTASPSPVVLPLPTEAAAATPQGAAAFTRYYFEILNQAFATGDSAPVRALSDPGCDSCNRLIGAIEEEPTPGERIEGGDYRIVFAESPPAESGDVIVELRYALTEVRVVSPDGNLIRTKPGVPAVDAQLRLIRKGDAWIVRGFRNVKP